MYAFTTPALLSLRRAASSTAALRSVTQHTTPLRPVSPRRTSSLYMSTATTPGAHLPGTVGFIGLGVMGLPMAQNLAASGSQLVVWNRSAPRADELLATAPDGLVRVASSAADVVRASDVTFAMLSTPAASRSVLHDGGALSALAPGKALVDCSTLTEADMEASAAVASAQGASFLEAPVSGSKGPAEQGSLIFLCGGDRDLFDKVKPALDVMGKRSFFLGDVGKGTRMKLVVNQVMGAALVALAEGIALSEAVGIDVGDLLDVLDIGATGNPMFKLKGPGMKAETKQYSVNFPLEHALKDMKFARQLGDAHDVDMPMSAAATELFQKADDMGLGREDFAAVMESVRAARQVASKA